MDSWSLSQQNTQLCMEVQTVSDEVLSSQHNVGALLFKNMQWQPSLEKGFLTSQHHTCTSLVGWEKHTGLFSTTVLLSEVILRPLDNTAHAARGEREREHGPLSEITGPSGFALWNTQNHSSRERGERKAASRGKKNVHAPQYLLD